MQEDINSSKSVRYVLEYVYLKVGGVRLGVSEAFLVGQRGKGPGSLCFVSVQTRGLTVYNYLTSYYYTYHSLCLCSSANLYHYTPFFTLFLL